MYYVCIYFSLLTVADLACESVVAPALAATQWRSAKRRDTTGMLAVMADGKAVR